MMKRAVQRCFAEQKQAQEATPTVCRGPNSLSGNKTLNLGLGHFKSESAVG
jgi:hypothetical protein